MRNESIDHRRQRKRTIFPISRVKKIMLLNEEIGKINPGAPIVLGKATEIFVARLTEKVTKMAEKKKLSKIGNEEVAEVVNGNDEYAFLRVKFEEKKE